MAFQFHSFATPLQHQQQESPRAIGGRVSNANDSRMTFQASTAAAESRRLIEEYDAEAARLAEQAEFCGFPRDVLSSKTRQNLQLVALMASTLQLREARPELILAAWASLKVKHSKVSTLRSKLQLGKFELMQKLRVADAVNSSLCQGLHDVEAQLRAWELLVQDLKQTTTRHEQKALQYQGDLAKSMRQLDKDGFSEEITHTKLADKHITILQLQQVLAQKRAEVATYHDLPASLPGAQHMLRAAQRQLIESKQELQSRMA